MKYNRVLTSVSLVSLLGVTSLLGGCDWGIREPLFPGHQKTTNASDNSSSVRDNGEESPSVSSGGVRITGPAITGGDEDVQSVEQIMQSRKNGVESSVERNRNEIREKSQQALDDAKKGVDSAVNVDTDGYRIVNGVRTKVESKDVAILNPVIYPAKGGFLDCPHRGLVPFYKTGWTYDYVLHLKLSSVSVSGYTPIGKEISVPVTTSDSWNSFIDFGSCNGYGLVAHWRKDTLNTGRTFIDYTFYRNNSGFDTEISSTHTIEVDPDTGHEVSGQEITIDAQSVSPGLQISGVVTVTPGQNYKQIYYQNRNHPHYSVRGSGGFGGSFPGESGYSGGGSGRFVDESVNPETGGVGPLVK